MCSGAAVPAGAGGRSVDSLERVPEAIRHLQSQVTCQPPAQARAPSAVTRVVTPQQVVVRLRQVVVRLWQVVALLRQVVARLREFVALLREFDVEAVEVPGQEPLALAARAAFSLAAVLEFPVLLASQETLAALARPEQVQRQRWAQTPQVQPCALAADRRARVMPPVSQLQSELQRVPAAHRSAVV